MGVFMQSAGPQRKYSMIEYMVIFLRENIKHKLNNPNILQFWSMMHHNKFNIKYPNLSNDEIQSLWGLS